MSPDVAPGFAGLVSHLIRELTQNPWVPASSLAGTPRVARPATCSEEGYDVVLSRTSLRPFRFNRPRADKRQRKAAMNPDASPDASECSPKDDLP
jgi:hypothetical protein